MKAIKKISSPVMRGAILLALTVCAAACGNLALAQTPQLPPQPQPLPKPQVPNLKPLFFVNVSLDGIAKPLSSFTGAPLPTPEFFIPRSGAPKVLEFRTKDGRAGVHFSFTLASGTPPFNLGNAFEWQQTSVPAPDAVGRLIYNGCPNCPASFTISVKAEDPSGAVSTQVKLNLVASAVKPSLTSIARSGGSSVEPRFEIRFPAGTFDPVEGEVIGVYAGNLKYRLLPETTSNFAGGNMFVVIPRLKAERGLQVFLRNPHGASELTNITLPIQPGEDNPPFEPVNASTVLGNANLNDAYSVKHRGGLLDINGTDEITIAPRHSGATPCDQKDFIYTGARASWLDANDHPVTNLGTVNVSSQPPINALLRSPQNRLRVDWKLNALAGDRWYQIVFKGIDVIGVCPNRVVQ